VSRAGRTLSEGQGYVEPQRVNFRNAHAVHQLGSREAGCSMGFGRGVLGPCGCGDSPVGAPQGAVMGMVL
jgi:hypothetical protein